MGREGINYIVLNFDNFLLQKSVNFCTKKFSPKKYTFLKDYFKVDYMSQKSGDVFYICTM